MPAENTPSSESHRVRDGTDAGKRRAAKPLWRRTAGVLLLFAVVPYLVIVVMLGLIQRKLIYFPSKAEVVPPSAAGLPAGQVHAVSVTTDDGLQLHGWLVLADGRRAEVSSVPDAADHPAGGALRDAGPLKNELTAGRPVVIYFHGNAGHRGHRGLICRGFTSQGADVILFDYRGYGENAGSPSEQGLHSDARAIWRFAAEELGIDSRRIVLFGESIGGGVAVPLAADLCAAGTPPGGLLLQGAFTSLVDTAATHYPWLPVRWVMLDRYPLIERIGEVACPIVLLHGGRDEIIPVELARRLFAAAPDQSASGVEKRFVEVPGAGHNDIPPAKLSEAFGILLRSLR